MTNSRSAVALLAVATVLTGCGEQGLPADRASPAPAIDRIVRTASMTPSGSHAPLICKEDGRHVPSAALIGTLGAPAEQVRFPLSEPITEFRIKLLNHFRLPQDKITVIWERTWKKGDCRLTIWSARRGNSWQPVDWLHWSGGDQF